MQNDSGGFNLSFLDLLCCSLGGTILLFVIFSGLEHQGSRESLADSGKTETALMSFSSSRKSGDDVDLPVLYKVVGEGNLTINDISENGQDKNVKMQITATKNNGEYYIWIPSSLKQNEYKFKISFNNGDNNKIRFTKLTNYTKTESGQNEYQELAVNNNTEFKLVNNEICISN